MPHLVLEYSRNLADRFDPQALLAELHQALVASGVVKLAGLKSRAIAYDIEQQLVGFHFDLL